MYRIERSDCTVMAEEDGGDCDRSIVSDGVGLGKFGIIHAPSVLTTSL